MLRGETTSVPGRTIKQISTEIWTKVRTHKHGRSWWIKNFKTCSSTQREKKKKYQSKNNENADSIRDESLGWATK